MGECLDLAAFRGCAGPIMGLTCMCQDRCSHQLCQCSYQDLVALAQVHHHHHHYHPPPCDCETAENQPLTEPTRHAPCQTDRQPPPHNPRPTHSFSWLNSRDHQHSHTTIFSQGPRVSDLRRLYKDCLVLCSGWGWDLKASQSYCFTLVSQYLYKLKKKYLKINIMIMFLGQYQSLIPRSPLWLFYRI